MTGEIASSQNVRTDRSESHDSFHREAADPVTKLSVNEVTTYRWSLLDDVIGYQEAGIGAIGVWRPKLAEFGEERSIELLRDSGLSVSSVSWAGGFTGAHGYSYQEAIDDAVDAIQVASAINANCLVIASGSRSGHTANHARRLLVDALTTLGDVAEEYGVPLAIQPMHPLIAQDWTFLTCLDDALDILDRCAHPFVRLAFDVFQLWQEPRLLSRIDEVAPFVSTVQLSDWNRPPRTPDDRCLIGDGQIPLADIVQAFLAAGYDNHFEIGIRSESLWAGGNYDDVLQVCRSRFEGFYPAKSKLPNGVLKNSLGGTTTH